MTTLVYIKRTRAQIELKEILKPLQDLYFIHNESQLTPLADAHTTLSSTLPFFTSAC